MTTTEATLAGIVAVIVFWIVGAYNRMVRLRSDLVARFAAVDERYKQRHALLERQLELLSTTLSARRRRASTPCVPRTARPMPRASTRACGRVRRAR